MAIRRDYIAGLYRDLLGREGSDSEIEGHINNPGGESGLREHFMQSPEYAARTGGQASWYNDSSGAVVNAPPPAAPVDPVNPIYTVQGDPDGRVAVPRTGGSPTPPPTTTPTPTQYSASAIETLKGFYRKYLGREATEDEVNRWLSGQFGWGDSGNLSGIERGISWSDEARRRAVTAGTPPTNTPWQHDYSAFNTQRAQDPSRSAKDAFALYSNLAPPPPFHDRAALRAWFNQYIAPGMNSLGHRIINVTDDGFEYENHEGRFFVDFAQNAGAAPGSMQQRLQWLATPADDATRRRYGVTGGGSGTPGGGAGTNRTTGGGGGNPLDWYTQLANQYAGPGGPGQTKGPLEQVAQDPLSKLTTGALIDFISRGGSTAFGEDVRKILMEGINGNNPNVMRRFESARELMSKGRRTMMNDARAELAHRGLLSEPGIPQGAEIGAVKRIEETIAPEFARALRDIYTEETTKSLQLATGMAADQARTFLAAIGEGTQRQTALAGLALQSLQQNMAWNQFLAEFGLKRESMLQMLQQGRVNDVMQLLNSFLSLASLSRGGFV